MRAELDVYDDLGQRILITDLHVHFATNEKTPSIDIQLPDGLKLKKGVNGSVYLHLEGLAEEIKKNFNGH